MNSQAGKTISRCSCSGCSLIGRGARIRVSPRCSIRVHNFATGALFVLVVEVHTVRTSDVITASTVEVYRVRCCLVYIPSFATKTRRLFSGFLEDVSFYLAAGT